ncbi:hypothetical protein ACQY0O_006948 [Thecaphora frezii]
MDIYDRALTQQQPPDHDGTDAAAAATASASTSPATSRAQPSLEAEVSNLVTGISSWWSGVAQKSQASISQAKQHVDKQGGLLSFAKSEYTKLEAQIADAQKKARQESFQPPASDIDAAAAVAPAAAPAGSSGEKGKQRAVDQQDPVAAASSDAEAVASASEEGTEVSSTPRALASGTEGSGPLDAASAFFGRVTSQLTSDPRVAALQRNLLASLPTSKGGADASAAADREAGDGSQRAAAGINVQQTLSNLSRTLQAHLPHLELGQTQQLASRYLEASENFAKDLGKDMRELANELVRIVPPEEQQQQQHDGKAEQGDEKRPSEDANKDVAPAAAVNEGKKEAEKAAPAETAGADVKEEEDDFVWDEEDEADKADKAAPAVAPQTKGEEARKEAQALQPPRKPEKDDDGSDSDWE